MYRILEALLHHPAMHAPRPWLAATSSLQKVVVVAVVVAVESDKKKLHLCRHKVYCAINSIFLRYQKNLKIG